MSPCLRKHQQMNYNLFTTKFIHPWRYFPFCFQARQLSSVSGRRFKLKSICPCFLRFHTIEILVFCNSFGMYLLGVLCIIISGRLWLYFKHFLLSFISLFTRITVTSLSFVSWGFWTISPEYKKLGNTFRVIRFEFIFSSKYWNTIILVIMPRSLMLIRGGGGSKK